MSDRIGRLAMSLGMIGASWRLLDYVDGVEYWVWLSMLTVSTLSAIAQSLVLVLAHPPQVTR